MTKIRTGQAPAPMTRSQFHERFSARFYDPAFEAEREAIARLEAIAWEAVQDGRKAPITRPAGRGFADPGYEVSVQWLDTRKRLRAAQKRWADRSAPSRVLLVCGSARNDGTCPGEVSKTWRLTGIAQRVVERAGMQADVLDLSLVTSEYGRTIHPCKGCVSSAMPLCHWPCSCYPNHALNQADDWMAEIYERWVAAHAVVILAPTYWYQSPSPLKLMIDRLVCGRWRQPGSDNNPWQTRGRSQGHRSRRDGITPSTWPGGPMAWWCMAMWPGSKSHRRNLTDWLDWMGLIDAGSAAKLDRYIGYYQPYYSSHDALDEDKAVQQEARNVALAVASAVKALRAGLLSQPDKHVRWPRPK